MPRPFALTHVSVIVGDPDGTVHPDQTVVVAASGEIERVGPASEIDVPSGHRVIAMAGRFVVPGLINAHAHLFSDGRPVPPILLNPSVERIVGTFGRSPAGQRLFGRRTRANVLTQLHSGVTTIRSVGDVGYEVVKVANEIEAGKYVGPRLLPAGPLMAITGGHGAPQIALISDSPWEARRNTRRNVQHGVKVIKISATGGVTDARVVGQAGRPEMTEEEMAAICDEAHKAGIQVAAHAQSREGILAALRAGVDTIEHGAGLTDEIIELFHHNPRALNGTSALIPTLQVCLPLVKLDREITGVDEVVKANAELVLDEMIKGINDARANGVTIGTGTDSGLTYATHYDNWRELNALVDHGGLTRAEALHAATRTNAKILGLDQVTGSIEPGRAADLVVLQGNPLDDLRAFVDPVLVVTQGHLIEKPTVTRFPDIDATLDAI